MKKIIFILSMTILMFNGCKQEPMYIPEPPVDKKLVISKILAEELLKNKTQEIKGSLVMTSLVNLNNFKETSNFGRSISEDLINEMFKLGFSFKELRGSNNIFINNKGEFNLSRDVELLKKELKNTYIVVGTYSSINENIYINVRIIDNQTGKIISTASLKTEYQFNLRTDISRKSIELRKI